MNGAAAPETGETKLEAAISYVQWNGWHVFPIHWPVDDSCSCKNPDCQSPAKHPLTPNGFKDATTDTKIIKKWWTKWPSANIGIATGAVSGIVVVDIDSPDAKADLQKILPTDYDINLVARSSTGRGWHLVFAHPGGEVKNRTGILPRIDVRGDGGYFIVEPSTHINGKKYTWQVSPAGELRKLPIELYRLIAASNHNRNGEGAKFDSSIVWEGIPEGQRDDALFRYACQLRGFNAPRDVADRLILEAAALCRPPFPADQVLAKVTQAWKYAAGHSQRQESPSEDENDGDNAQNAHFAYPQQAKPLLSPEALHGLAGEIVNAIEPFTESDLVAVLSNILTAFGNVVGPIPYFRVEHTKHHLNLFIAQVGDTSKGRKGTAWSTPKRMLTDIDSAWTDSRVTGGLSSGEGVIYAVRDERYEKKPVHEKGRVVDYQNVLVDEGVTDKRLLLIEEELSQALKVMWRDGNILSAIVRQAWDSGNLHPLTKSNPIRATDAHISIIGHITREELLRYLTETEQANGFANRFIWLMVYRSKCIPNPTGVPEEILSPLIEKLRNRIEAARRVGEMVRTDEAETVWAGVYPALSDGKPGLIGRVLGRAEAQVMRLACIYALLDGFEIVGIEHLAAALALWDYSEKSAMAIFGEMSGDPTADRILAAFDEQMEMTETDIYNLFGRHIPSNEIQRALNALETAGKARRETVATGGRPKTIWRRCAKSEESAES